jgi:signal transduction histidine kinase
VLDTGCGIPYEDLDRVKDKFFKSNKTVRGSGIGLAVADEIVKLHGGLLFIDSQEGAGTAVTILFPAKAKSEEDVLDAAAEKLENRESEPDAGTSTEA